MAETSKSCPDIAEVLNTLRTANHLGVYAQQRDSVFSIVRSMPSEEPRLQKLTTAFAHVISVGLNLVSRLTADDQQQATLETADSLYCCVEAYGVGLYALKGSTDGKARLLYDVASAGLLQAIASAAGTLRSLTISKHQGHTPTSIDSTPSRQATEAPAAAKHGQDPPKAAASASAADPLVCFSKPLYRLFDLLIHIWPDDQVLSSEGFPEAMLSTAGLAVEQLQCLAAAGKTAAVDTPATAAPEGSSSSSSSSSINGSAQYPVQRHPFMDLVGQFADIVSVITHNEVVRPIHPLQPAITRQVMQSDALLYFVCWQMARAAQYLHSESAGAVSAAEVALAGSAAAAPCSVSTSSSNQKQQPPGPAYHLQLYSALNMLPPGQPAIPERSIPGVMALLFTLITHRMGYNTRLSGGSVSMDRTELGLEVINLLRPAVIAPLLLTSVEMLMLPPPQPARIAHCSALITLLTATLRNQKRIIPQAEADEAYLSLLRPVLFELLPYIRQCVNIPEIAGMRTSPQEVYRHLTGTLGEVISASQTAATDKLAEDLAAALSEQPVSTAAAYETALRFTTWKEEQSMQPQPPEFSPSITRANICTILHTVLGRQGPGSVTASGNSLAAAVAADPSHLGMNLWSLLMSELKGVLRMARSHLGQNGDAVTAALQIAAAAIAVGADDAMVLDYFQIEQSDSRVVKVVSQMLAQQQQQQQHGSGVAAAAAAAAATADSGASPDPEQLWLVLVGRGLYVLGEALKQMFRVSAPTQGVKPALAPLVPVALAAVHWVGKQLPLRKLPPESAAAVAAQAMGKLLERQQALQTELQQEVDKMKTVAEVLGDKSDEALEGIAAMCLCAAAAGISNLGAALGSELPVDCCCANPGCVNMNESSEVLLASKGGGCGGCRVVRYCGVECQRQHWKLHKRVCARYKVDKAK